LNDSRKAHADVDSNRSGVTTDLSEAEEKFERDLLDVFSGVRLIPHVSIGEIDHAGYAEDGETFTVTCTTIEGDTLFVSLCRGEPISVRLQRGDGREPTDASDSKLMQTPT
jgi:hypothetical protein